MNDTVLQQVSPKEPSNDGLNPKQREAVDYTAGHLLIVAGPGTGKTHTITRKIFTLLSQNKVDPDRIVAVTFTRKAGEQLTQRLRKLLPGAARLPFAGTFHSFCLQILRAHWKKEFRILSRQDQSEILESVDGNLVSYGQKLQELNALDFDGILSKTLELIRNDESLKRQLHRKIRYLFVDEYQDVNETQYFLIREITGPDTVLCAIGDPDQAIYSFRGADVQHFLSFEEDFPGTKILNLEQNYRSTSNIVECANMLIEHNTRRVHKNLRGVGERGPGVTLTACQTPLSEAIWIANEITRLVGGTDTSSMDRKTGSEYEKHYHFTDIAVIYRTNIQGKLLETAIKKEGLPYQRLAGTLWYQEPEIGILMQHAAFMLDPRNLPEEYRGFQNQYEELRQNLENQTPAQALKNILAVFQLDMQWNQSVAQDQPGSQTGKSWANVLRLMNFATQFDDLRGSEGLRTFFDELKLLQEHDAYDERMQAVTLMSIHASKGLEFPVIFIAGMEEGTLPYIPKKTDNDDPSALKNSREEERRLMYVGLTRAKERLFLSRAKNRREKPVEPSGFIREIESRLVEIGPPKQSSRKFWKKKQLSMW